MKFLIPLCFLFTGSAAFAHDHGKDMAPMSKEDRAKMAAVHEAMASCLKSERTDKDCMDEMHKGHDSVFPGKMHSHGKLGKPDGKKKDAAKP